MTPLLLVAALAVAGGVFLVVTALPFAEGRPSLADRLAAFDLDACARARRIGPRPKPLVPWPALDVLLRPFAEDLAGPIRLLGGWLGPLAGRDLERELGLVARDGRADVGGFVLKQVGLATLIASWPWLPLLFLRWPLHPLVPVLSAFGALVGFVLPYAELDQQLRGRRRRTVAELPQVSSLLVLALSAGVGLESALARAADRCGSDRGVLGNELHALVGPLSGDRSLEVAVRTMASRNRIAELSHFADLLSASAKDGLPVAETLQTFSTTLLEQSANRLLEAGDKGGVKMLFPLALLMVPTTLVVVLIPALWAFQQALGGP
jgi:hypothetical protein